MNLFDCELWKDDLKETLASLSVLHKIAGKSILITGCNGLICSAIVDLIACWNESQDNVIEIYAAARDQGKTLHRFFPYIKEPWFHYINYDATANDNQFPDDCNYIIHGASNASPNKIVKEPVETMISNINGLKQLLDYARNGNIDRIAYISSSEVYGRMDNKMPYKTNEYGYVDLLNPRNSYAVSKRAAETMCIAYKDEYGVDSVIVRPGHIYGPTATKADNRVSSAWAFDAAQGHDIVMKSEGSQIRSYCYCLDCAAAILTILIRGEVAHAYNISNPESIISIREMAEIISKAAGVNLYTAIPNELEKKGFNPMQNSSLDASDLIELGWTGLFDAERGLSHTIEILRESFNSN